MKALGWFLVYVAFVTVAAQGIGRALDMEYAADMRVVAEKTR